MTPLAFSSKGPSSTARLVVVLLAFAGVFAFLVRGYHDEREALHFRDFKQPYASARCLLTGCDPYSEPATRAAFLAAGGRDDDKIVFDPYSALYPPFSLVALLPVAALPYPTAHAVWEALIAAGFSLAALLAAQLCLDAGAGAALAPVALLSALTASSTILLMLGQISGVVIALVVIAFFCLLRERFLPAAAVCFFVALMLKPHDAALPFLYLLFAGPRWRRVFYVAAGLSIVFAGASLLWFAHAPAAAHWLAELEANLQGNAAPGSVNSPAPGHPQAVNLTDLQAVFAAVRDRARFYNGTALALSVLLFGAWLAPVVRLRNGLPKHLPAIAAMACLALLPIYHRQYDTRILLLAFPAVAFVLARRRAWGFVGLSLLTVATVVSTHQYLNRLIPGSAGAGPARTLALYRPMPEVLLLLFLYFAASLWLLLRDERRMSPRPDFFYRLTTDSGGKSGTTLQKP